MSTADGKGLQLTERQEAMLAFIERRHSAGELPPTMQDFMDELGITSKSVVSHNLKRLEVKRYIRRDENKYRGIKLLNCGPAPAEQAEALRAVCNKQAESLERLALQWKRRDLYLSEDLAAIANALRSGVAETGAHE